MTRAPIQQDASIQELCINAVRALSMDAVEAANSGHPGTPMALAPLCYLLWTQHLRHNPKDPAWPGRDRFVLSCGHASMLLYSLLHLSGYDLSLEEIQNFRQWGSKTPGHPEHGHTAGVETTTGPLGQGLGNAVGMALAEAHLAAVFGKDAPIRHRTFFVASDGDLMEGVSHEAASLAGHLRLANLIGFYDDNHITIEGETELAVSDDAAKRFESYGWAVLRVEDGNDLRALDQATRAAIESDRPALVVVRTHIAFGSPNKQDTAEAHGAPLGKDEVALTKRNLGWPYTESFFVPDEVRSEWRRCVERGAQMQSEWKREFAAYAERHARQAREIERRWRGDRPSGWESVLPAFEPGSGPMATRAASGKILNAIASRIPELVGGSADLAPSTNTLIQDSTDFSASNYAGRNLRFGIREHGMGAVLNGMALHGGVLPYGATFLVFSDYMRPAVRLAALMKLHTIYVYTHDSVGLGEDGPTHQPIETLSALRAIPNLSVVRPADANETVAAWKMAIDWTGGPVALALTRQKLQILDRSQLGPASGLARGAYVLSDPEGGAPDLILMSSGSEVSIVLEAQELLRQDKIRARVVSFPCHELFATQPRAYRDSVLPPTVRRRLAVEAAHPMSWYRWVGDEGEVLGIEDFGHSAPYERIYEELGLTPANIASRARRLLESGPESTI